MTRRPRTTPDPVGIALLLALLSMAMLLALCGAATSEARSGDALLDLVGLVCALFVLLCLRWIYKALARWRTLYNNYKPPHHEDDHY